MGKKINYRVARLLAFFMVMVMCSQGSILPEKVRANGGVSLRLWLSDTDMGNAIGEQGNCCVNRCYYLCYEVVDDYGQRVQTNGSIVNQSITDAYGSSLAMNSLLNVNHGSTAYIPILTGVYKGEVTLLFNGQILTSKTAWYVIDSSGNQNPVITQAPQKTTEPYITYAPNPTQEPYVTYGPYPTWEPYVTYAPYPTWEPYVTYAPYPTWEPYVTYAPYPTWEPYVTYAPYPTQEPYVTYVPYVTGTPVITVAPNYTASPSVTVKPTATPKVTSKPTATPKTTTSPTLSPQEVRGSYDLEHLYYNFYNSNTSMGYSSNYRIPIEVFRMFYDDSRASYLYNAYSLWGGSCFGFSSSSAMFNTLNTGLNLKDYSSYASKVHDLGKLDKNTSENLTVRTMLEATQVMQFDNQIQAEINKHYTHSFTMDLRNMIQAIKDESIVPPVLCVYREDVGGHALMPYAFENYSATEDRLHLYDCNYGNEDRYLSLYKSGNSYTGWYYSLNDMYDIGSNYAYSYISWVSYENYMSVWQKRSTKKNTSNLIYMYASEGDLDVLDEGGEKVAAIQSGNLISYNSGIFKLCEMAIREQKADARLYIPTGKYKIRPEKMTELTISISGETKNTTIKLTTDQIVTFNLTEDENQIEITPKEGTNYQVELASDSKTKNVQRVGTGDGRRLNFQQESEQEQEEDELPTKGTICMDDAGKAYYKIISEGSTVSFVKPVNTSAKNIRIGTKTTIDGRRYKVVDISSKAFVKCRKLQKLELPDTITSIGEGIVANCSKLEFLVIRSTKLKKSTVASKVCSGISKKTVIKVPKKKLTLYKRIFTGCKIKAW